MKLGGLRWLVAFAALVPLAAFVLPACGSSGNVSQGYWAGAAAPAGATADDAGVFVFDAGWPTTPGDAAGAATGAPTFGEGGASPVAPFVCTGKTGAAGESTMTLESSGGLRDAILHVPAAYDPTVGAMLVVNYHGFSSNSWEEELLTFMDTSADAHDFIVAYPDGIASSWNAGTCCGVSWTDSVDDVQFTKDLLAKIASEYCIDPARIYATGMSNGAFLSHRLGCEMADVFAAIAPVAGVMGIPDDECKPSRPIPVLDFHGTADPVVPFAGGAPITPLLGAFVQFDSVADTIALWRSLDSCLAAPALIYSTGDATCTDFGGCRGGAEVVQCVIDGGGHTWPGGLPIPPLGKTSTDISATDTMVDFFLAHPMPPGQSATVTSL
jgi:polyhydroxybutyrate depolymerase